MYCSGAVCSGDPQLPLTQAPPDRDSGQLPAPDYRYRLKTNIPSWSIMWKGNSVRCAQSGAARLAVEWGSSLRTPRRPLTSNWLLPYIRQLVAGRKSFVPAASAWGAGGGLPPCRARRGSGAHLDRRRPPVSPGEGDTCGRSSPAEQRASAHCTPFKNATVRPAPSCSATVIGNAV